MADTITVTYKVNEDGSLSKIAKGADKAAQATDRVTKASAGHNKVQKGVAQTGLSSAKSFSKMSSGIQGGLVPAYATLAAHVFAVTAAFGVLSRSQAVKQLNEGLLFTGRAAGENLTIVTKNLREITQNAVSSADAMRALAVGVSAGFSEDQMEGLTKVAKGASLALGRDMTDALDRLVRGAAKLEPEILDELGIMVRLDDATEKYAASIGIAATELTQFERRMAFTNAIIEQGESKFGALSATVASNPFNQLAATFDDLVKGGMNFINLVIGPIAGFLAGNMGALIATMGILGTGVINMMVPALTEAGAASADLAKQMANSAKETIAATKATAGSPKVFTNLSAKIANGTASAKDYTKAQDSLRKSVDLHKKQLPGMLKTHKADSDIIKKKVLTIKENEFALHQLTNAQEMETLSTQKAAQADILANASAGNFKITIQLLRAEMIRESIQLKISTLEKGFLASAYARLTMWARLATLSVKAFGLALLQSIPIIGQVIMVSMLLWEGIKWLFGSDAKATVSPLADVLEEGKERFEEFPNIIKQMAESYEMASNNSERYLISLKAQNGLMKQTLTHVRDLRIAESVNQGMDLAAARRKLAAAKETEVSARALLKTAGIETTEGEDVGMGRKILEMLAGEKLRGGVDSGERVGAINSVNQALEDQARLTGQIAQLEAAAAGPSEERLLSTREAYLTLSETLKAGLADHRKGSEEYKLMSANIAEVDTILSTLSAETIKDAEDAFSGLSREVNKTEASFQALKDVGAEVEALFAKKAVVSGVFADEIKVLDKGLAAIVRTLDSDVQTKELAAAFEKFGVSNKEELQSLRDRYAAMNEYRKAEGLMLQTTKNYRDSLNNAGLKDVALQQLSAEQTLSRTMLIKEQFLAIQAGEDGYKQELKLLKLASEQEKTRLDIIKERQSLSARLGSAPMGSVTQVTAYAESNADTFEGAGDADQIKMLSEAIQPMMKDLEKLGPEGDLIASAIQGTLLLGESFERLTEQLQTLGFTSNMTFDQMKAKFSSLDFGDQLKLIGAGLQMAGSAVAALGNAVAAAAANNISGVDNQITAEKKRDGQSAASLQKIKALEAKKEQMKRKEFETNKKFQMANAIIATAVGITQALAIPGIGLFLAPMIAAMGMAQVAIISGMSYQGGASGAGASVPSKVSAGSRGSSVDLAKTQSASGELGYLRGESGVGGAENFKPAFSGYKHRAAGGYVVGEQGPELFMPEVPGEILPSGQGMGGSTNVNFSIQAVDADGVEDLLVRQRGNIIGMMREAANSYGQDFMEGIDTSIYTPSSAGATKY